MPQAQISNVRSLEWWRSEEALPKRCANYLALWLASDPANRREAYKHPIHPGPDYPAIWYYDANTDMPTWLEIRYATHVRDYALGYPENLNEKAKALARHR